jgi:hypothetical protein
MYYCYRYVMYSYFYVCSVLGILYHYVVLCIVFVSMCTVLMSSGVNTIAVNIYIYIYIYTGCNRRNGPDFGRVFLMLNYTEKTQNTYIQS